MADNKNFFPTPNNSKSDSPMPEDFKLPSKEQDYDPEPVVIDKEDDDLQLEGFNVFLDDGVSDGGDSEVGKFWYVVHCYSGYENKVRHGILQRIDTMGMKDRIYDVLIPTEEEVEIKDGKRRTVERRVFPGYILVQMRLDEDSWYVVRNTPGVTGFVGMGNDPTPLTEDEVKKIITRMDADSPKKVVDFKLGEKVRIVGGPFNDMIGTVSDIDTNREKVRVMVDFFGRETPVELDFLEVERNT